MATDIAVSTSMSANCDATCCGLASERVLVTAPRGVVGTGAITTDSVVAVACGRGFAKDPESEVVDPVQSESAGEGQAPRDDGDDDDDDDDADDADPEDEEDGGGTDAPVWGAESACLNSADGGCAGMGIDKVLGLCFVSIKGADADLLGMRGALFACVALLLCWRGSVALDRTPRRRRPVLARGARGSDLMNLHKPQAQPLE